MLKSLLASAALIAFAAPAFAADTYDLDPTHSDVIWMASHMGFSKSIGKFAEVSGHFTIDENEPAKSSVEVSINTASIMTGFAKFDEHLKSGDFFDVANHPTASFKSSKIVITGENSADIHGDLTMLGKTNPLVLKATKNKIGENPYNKKQTAGFSLTGIIDRSKYGMEYGVPGVPAEVQLIAEVEAIKRDEAAVAPKAE